MAVPRIAVIKDSCIPTYRRAFFEQLAAVGDREYVAFHSEAEPNSGIVAAEPPYRFPNVFVKCRFIRILGRTLMYQPVIWKIGTGGFSALVIGHELKFVSNVVLFILFRLLGKPVIFWGHGTTNDYLMKRRSALGRRFTKVVDWIKRMALLAASGYLAYTNSGAERVVKAGMARDRVTTLWNTIDISEEIAAHAVAQSLDRTALRAEFGIAPDAVVLLFIGRIYPPKRVDLLLSMARRLRREDNLPVEVVIVGSGPDEAKLRQEYGAESWCKFLGPLYDAPTVGRIFRLSDCVVMPTKVGLVVNHAFAHGVPVITRDDGAQPPEIDYIKHGENGLILPDAEGLYAALRDYAADPERRRSLAAGALKSREQLQLGTMVRNFDAAVAQVLGRRPD